MSRDAKRLKDILDQQNSIGCGHGLPESEPWNEAIHIMVSSTAQEGLHFDDTLD